MQLFQCLNEQSLPHRIITYKVVPLSPQHGVVQWADSTIPLGAILNGAGPGISGGLHRRINPNDILNHEARNRMGEVRKNAIRRFGRQSLDQIDKECIAEYEDIAEHFRPVFSHFFLETFKNPREYWKATRNYAKSLAVTSIQCHIFGIGDRHLNNVLVNQTTGELVRIFFFQNSLRGSY